MKIFNKILCGIAVCAALVETNGFGQGRGSDLFGVPRSILVTTPATMTATTTNGAFDTHGYDGIGVMDFYVATNSAGTGQTVTPQSSSDNTNWTSLLNYAIATNIVQIVTNTYYGSTNLFVTNSYYIPGTVTVPVSGTAGFANTYLLPAPFTNSGALTVGGPGIYEIGYDVADAPRYTRLIWTPGASTTNQNGALFKGFRNQ